MNNNDLIQLDVLTGLQQAAKNSKETKGCSHESVLYSITDIFVKKIETNDLQFRSPTSGDIHQHPSCLTGE